MKLRKVVSVLATGLGYAAFSAAAGLGLVSLYRPAAVVEEPPPTARAIPQTTEALPLPQGWRPTSSLAETSGKWEVDCVVADNPAIYCGIVVAIQRVSTTPGMPWAVQVLYKGSLLEDCQVALDLEGTPLGRRALCSNKGRTAEKTKVYLSFNGVDHSSLRVKVGQREEVEVVRIK